MIDSPFLQRLRHIRQLATTSWVYPGAVHTRFEHALGTMELGGRAFTAAVRNSDPTFLAKIGLPQEKLAAAERLVRLGGLLHDIGHTPFSHALEGLLPIEDGRRLSHEDLTHRLVVGELSTVLQADHLATVNPAAVAAIAVGAEHADLSDSMLKLLSDLITGTLGVDRMDYLLRDSHYTGVTYGRFDLERLIGTLKIVPDSGGTPVWALDAGGREIAEQMLLARYFMTLQVYSHKTRRILDIHLREFVGSWLNDGSLPSEPHAYLKLTDTEILSAMRQSQSPAALALTARKHHRMAVELDAAHFSSPADFSALVQDVATHFPEVRSDWITVSLRKRGDAGLFIADGSTVVELSESSELIQKLTPRVVARVYAVARERDDVRKYVASRIQ